MPINLMAWAASSTGLLLFAGSHVAEAPQVVNFAAVTTANETIASVQPTSLTSLPALPQSLTRLVALNLVAPNATTNDSPAASLSSSTANQLNHQDSFGIKPVMAKSRPAKVWFNCPGALRGVTQKQAGMFPVLHQGCPLAYTPNSLTADRLTQRLQHPQLDASQIKPALEGTLPVIRLGNETLLKITPQIADRFDQHAHDLAVQWSNHLRQALGAKPIALATAQKQMYGLQETAAVVLGSASWYGPYFHGRMTANGEIYDQYDLTAAHRDLPLGSFVQVTNRRNGRSIVVRINDRGPYLDEDNRIIDLSYQAARVLDAEEKGIAPIEMVVLKTVPKPQQPPAGTVALLP
jgi:rare lipoprotein A